MDKAAVIKQIDEVLARVEAISSKSKGVDRPYMPDELATEAVSLMTSAIERLAPPNSSYHKNAKLSQVTSHFQSAVSPLTGVLKALRVDFDRDFQSFQELMHADMFTDFLGMSEHLLLQGYKDAAAVICGSVLEEHLRKLASKNSISVLKPDGVHKKADTINSELTAAGAYSKLDQKGVTAWLDLRNKAAHGEYTLYTKDQVVIMLQGVQNFISRLPA